jgi:hypothetical protein
MVWYRVNELNMEVLGFISVVKIFGTVACKYRWICFVLSAVRHWK